MSVRLLIKSVSAFAVVLTAFTADPVQAEPLDGGHAAEIKEIIDAAVMPVMRQHDIPGLAVGLTIRGRQYFVNYGVAAKQPAKPVDGRTIFEIGSVSKILTATLAAYAEGQGRLSLSDPVSTHFPALAGTAFDRITLRDLGTYTAGGLPLQFPGSVKNRDSMIGFYRNWRPAVEPGSHRQYSNPSIGLLGHIAAERLGQPFEPLMQQTVFPAFGLSSSFIHVPKNRQGDYAWGYASDGKPVRVSSGVLDAEAYGVKTTAADLLRLVEVNINSQPLATPWRRAIATTQTGNYQVGSLIQGLGWDMYRRPVSLSQLLAGSSPAIIRELNKVTPLSSSTRGQGGLLINKTGSTRGFGAYVAFIPDQAIGIVLLANKSYPLTARVEVGHTILTAVEAMVGQP